MSQRGFDQQEFDQEFLEWDQRVKKNLEVLKDLTQDLCSDLHWVRNRGIIDTRKSIYELSNAHNSTLSIFREMYKAYDLLSNNTPLAKQFPNGEDATNALTPRQIIFRAGLVQDARRCIGKTKTGQRCRGKAIPRHKLCPRHNAEDKTVAEQDCHALGKVHSVADILGEC